MRKDNTANYQTPYTNIQHFNDFEANKGKESDELEKMKRSSFQKNPEDVYNLPMKKKLKYNRVTNKYDDLSKDEVEDKIKNIGIEKPSHKYKIIERFDDFEGQEKEVESHHLKSYMFFENLKTIRREVIEMLNFDERDVDSILLDGHNWAEDHISSSKELVEQVCDFICNQVNESIDEDDEEDVNYMFFNNLESIYDMCEGMIEKDEKEIDDILTDGHDWAEDHITSAKEKISHVYHFLKNELK
ncbi:hypothetical protein EBU94_05750 [bacterium]|nr:hypothetical protein [bacterium]